MRARPLLATVAALTLLAACHTIPSSAVSLSEELRRQQQLNAEHLELLVEGYGQVLAEEGRRVVAPYAEQEARVAKQVWLLEGLMAALANPAAGVPAEWAQEKEIVELVRQRKAGLATVAEWEPWIELARRDRTLLGSDVFDPNGAVKAPANITVDVPKLKLLRGFLAPYETGSFDPGDGGGARTIPAGLAVNALKQKLGTYDSLGANPARAQAVAEEWGKVVRDVLGQTAPAVAKLRDVLASTQQALVVAQSNGAAVLADLRTRRRTLEAEVEQVAASRVRGLKAMLHNASEVERGLDVLSESLRRGRDAFYRPVTESVAGIKSVAGILEEGGVIDADDLAKVTEKADRFEEKFREVTKRLETPSL
jgi:hypothetical protein